jgi:hypothetical protein
MLSLSKHEGVCLTLSLSKGEANGTNSLTLSFPIPSLSRDEAWGPQ